MKPDKITTYGLLEVCELISGTRTKTTDGPYFIYGAGLKAKGTTDKFNCESDTIRLTRKGTVGAVYFHRDPFWIDGDSFRFGIFYRQYHTNKNRPKQGFELLQ